MKINRNFNSGFTIVELITVVVVVAILAGVTTLAYGSWQDSLAKKAVQSDLQIASAAMENAKNFSNGYPSSLPSKFRASSNVNLSIVSASTTEYCLQATSTRSATIAYYIVQKGKPQTGSCPVIVPPVPTNLAGSITDSGGYDSYNDYAVMTITWTSASSSLAPNYEVQGCTVTTVANPAAGTRSCSSSQVLYGYQTTGASYYNFKVRAVAPDGITKSAWASIDVQYTW